MTSKQVYGFVKKHWLTILLVAIVIWLLFQLVQGRAREAAAVARAEEADRRVQRIEKDRKADSVQFANDTARMGEIIRSYDSAYVKSLEKIDKLDDANKGYIGRINRLFRQAREVRSDADTTEYDKNMDSAAREFDALSVKYAEMEFAFDELKRLQSSRDSASDALIEAYKQQVKSLTSAYLEVLEKYNILYKDFGKIAKKAKRRQIVNKILAAATLSAGGALLLTK